MLSKFILVFAIMFSIGSFSFAQDIISSNKMDDWYKAGNNPESYEIGKDVNVSPLNTLAYYIKSISFVKEGFGTIMTDIKPDKYFGKRIRLSGYLKSENIVNWAGMWMRVDGHDKDKSLSFDNMQNRPIKGTTDWTKYEIVLDVPENSIGISYGVLLAGNGQVWLSDLYIDEAGTDVPVTSMIKETQKVGDWVKAGSKPDLYDIGKVQVEMPVDVARPEYYLQSITYVKEGFGTIMKEIKPDNYIGKRIRLSSYIRSENIDNWAGMWMRVDGTDKDKSLSFDNMYDRQIKGTTDQTKYEIVLDVPETGTGIYYGVLINGNGKIVFSEPDIEIVGTDVPSTNMLK